MQITWTNLAISDLDSVERKLSLAHDTHLAEEDVFRILNTVEHIPQIASDERHQWDVVGTFDISVESLPCVVIYQIDLAVEQIQILRILYTAGG